MNKHTSNDWRKLLLVGLLAGFVNYQLRFGLNRYFLGRFLDVKGPNSALVLGPLARHHLAGILTLLGGMLATETYVKIRPRHAARLTKVGLAGFASWGALWLFPTVLWNLGRPLSAFTSRLLAIHLSACLLTTVVATAIGAWLFESTEIGVIASTAIKSRWTRVLASPEIAIGAFLIGVFLFKIILMRLAARGPIIFAIAQHDAAIIALLSLFYVTGGAVAHWTRNRGKIGAAVAIFSPLCMAVCLSATILYSADVFAYRFFGTRLYASDIVTFASEPHGVLSLLRPGWRVISSLSPDWIAAFAFVVLLILRAFYILLADPLRPAARRRLSAYAGIGASVLWLIPVPHYFYSYCDKGLYENVIERNKGFFVRSNFSDKFRAQIFSTTPPETCRPGRNRRLNVILLEVESLSAYQSQFFSGVENWTPALDNIARRETSLPNFYANGWTSIGGMISLLSRTFPFVPERTAFNSPGSPRLGDFLELPRPLPRTLSEQGYFTEFLGAGDITFLGQDNWLRTIGFQKLLGQDDPRFDSQKIRGPFKSVPDRLLYEVAMDEIIRMASDKPYFMVVQTFWSHRPFTDPNGGALASEAFVFRETDAQIGRFYETLMASGFFQNGILFITGDHRAEEPFRMEEFTRFGDSAIARIPAVIVTRAIDLPRVLPQDFQQRDFAASVEALIGDQYCVGPQEGAFLSDPPVPSECIMHARADDRDLVFVKCGTRERTVQIAGDATRFISGFVENESPVIQTINRTRARPINELRSASNQISAQ